MLNVLVCAVPVISLEGLKEFLKNHYVLFMPPGSQIPVDIYTVTLPLFPPSSPEQAALASAQYWPTIFTNTNPFGPHPAIVAQAQEVVQASAGKWMSLASNLASNTTGDSKVLPVGCVVVQQDKLGANAKLVAIATDARHVGMASEETQLDAASVARSGNVAGHAVMRAIALVARKRRELAAAQKLSEDIQHLADEPVKNTSLREPQKLGTTIDTPRNMLEASVLAAPSLEPDGYLCHNLTFYITHEPCTACTMAMVHSRVGAVVYERQMPNTGAMSAESRIRTVTKLSDHKANQEADQVVSEESIGGYGLFYRDELNWRFLAWEWKPYEDMHYEQLALPEDTHV